jgi:multidrug efflux pump subunit AcrA (membrane-fusion protein)
MTCYRILILVAALLLAGCGKEKKQEADADAATPVQTAKAVTQSIQQIITADAILYPVSQSAVTAKISAPVRRFLVNRGDHVKQGQLLAELEDRDLVSAADESKALYDQSEAQFQTMTKGTIPEDTTKAKTDVDTTRQALDAAKKLYGNRVALVREGALAQRLADDAKVALVQAQSQFDVAQRHLDSLQNVSRAAEIRAAQSQVDAASARLAGARSQVSYSEVRSPIDGIVADRALNAGEMASSGIALITVVNISEIVARANIPVREVGSVKVGDKAAITAPDGELTGRVTVVSPAVDPSSTTVEVWVLVRNPGDKLKPGVTAKVSIQARTISDAIVIPMLALLSSAEGENEVMLVGSDSVAHEQKVEIGVRQGDKVQITKGVRDGDLVVTSGGVGLADKTKVEVAHD